MYFGEFGHTNLFLTEKVLNKHVIDVDILVVARIADHVSKLDNLMTTISLNPEH